MMSLFNSFDLVFFHVSSLIFILFPLFLLNFVFLNGSQMLIFSKSYSAIEEFFYTLKSKGFNKISALLSISLIFSIIMLNFFSVFSYNFPLTSQFGMVFSVSFLLWVSFILFNTFCNYKGLISHMIPEGTPIYLTMFLFLIEVISNLIRPLTLTVRLVANILAGHLLMILLSKLVISSLSLFPFYMVLNSIEIFVSLIQAYIFTTMIILYFSEIH